MNAGRQRESYRPQRRQQLFPAVATAAATAGIWLGVVNDSRKTPVLVVLLPVAALFCLLMIFRLLDPRPAASFDESGVRFQPTLGLGPERAYGWDQVGTIGRLEPRVVSLNKVWDMKAVPDWIERRQARKAGSAFVVTTSDEREHVVSSAGPDSRLADFRTDLERRVNARRA